MRLEVNGGIGIRLRWDNYGQSYHPSLKTDGRNNGETSTSIEREKTRRNSVPNETRLKWEKIGRKVCEAATPIALLASARWALSRRNRNLLKLCVVVVKIKTWEGHVRLDR